MATRMQINAAGLSFIGRKPKGPMFETATKPAVSTSAEKRGVISSNSQSTLHQSFTDGHNAASLTIFCLRQPQANVTGARHKAIRALAALLNLSLALED